MVILRRAIARSLIAIALSPLAGQTGRAAAHPIHSTFAEVIHDKSRRSVNVSLRVFVDDYTEASLAHAQRLANARGAPVTRGASLVEYALATFSMSDAGGRRLSLQSCGGKRVGELMWLCFRAPAPRGLSGFQVMSRLLFEMYDDQINIVQASYGGKKTSLLFTRGDGAKRLP